MNSQPQQIQIKATDQDIKGRYSNIMQIQSAKEEFCLDFLNVFPPAGALVARIIINPGHLKRMLNVLQNTLKKHEKQFGTIQEAKEPKKPEMGFTVNK